ncbi:carbohydrate ABC transporter permease [Micromonospora sp. KC721]|uniref:carbohydrate ABC transporter permease n=1 Tax=Micromonospora sp. KC721 TaxID=2530380 RepID=UPI00104F95D1|nr:carbohydrate ABC transporter permease [Micromonospora sp. KC721]TDB81804.1 carbohydrate ABC transporter permease [Micromonospora sp. KC721]TDC43942.1 carbohydrate ABC transporter permease [Micromonospora sp. KC213]
MNPAPSTVRRAPHRRRSSDRVPFVVYAVLGVMVVLSVFPLYWMFVVATTDSATATSLPPHVLPGGNFLYLAGLVFDTVPFVQALLNSVVVATSIGVGQALLCALAGFAFAKLSFRGRNTLFLIVVLTMTVPAQLSVVPQYLIMSRLNWVDTLQALIVPGLVSAFGIFWMRQHIVGTIDDDLMNAARVDGATTWQIFWRIAFPLVRPAALVLGLFGFVNAWNDFLWPFIVLKSPERYTVQIAIKALQNNRDIDLGLAMSGSFLATLPLLVLFVFIGRRLVQGIMEGAFKG